MAELNCFVPLKLYDSLSIMLGVRANWCFKTSDEELMGTTIFAINHIIDIRNDDDCNVSARWRLNSHY